MSVTVYELQRWFFILMESDRKFLAVAILLRRE